MRILFISSLYGASGGGAGLIVSHLAHGLSALENQVTVITMGKDFHYTETEDPGLHVYRFRPLNIYPFEKKDTEPLWKRMIWQFVDVYNFHSAKVLRQILEKESPDIIHINKMRGFSGAVWSVSAQLFPGRVLQTCHDYESMSPDGLLRGSIGKMALQKRGPVRGYQLVRSKLSAGISTVTAPSRHTLQRIQASGLFPFANPKVIANTHGWSEADLKSFHQKTKDISKGEIRFLFLGRLEREKGIGDLCEAFLRAFHSQPSVYLDIVGSGTLDSELIRKYAKNQTINFLGMLNGRAKEEALLNATTVVIPSKVEEVFGLTTVEAYAFGKPVIASKIGGLPELVKHGETGWLFEAGNIEMLAERLEAVTRLNPVTLARISRNCQEYSYNFSLRRIVAQYVAIYNRLRNVDL